LLVFENYDFFDNEGLCVWMIVVNDHDVSIEVEHSTDQLLVSIHGKSMICDGTPGAITGVRILLKINISRA
jgi:hypothetical protein